MNEHANVIREARIEDLLVAVATPDACEDSFGRKLAWDEIKRRNADLAAKTEALERMEEKLRSAYAYRESMEGLPPGTLTSKLSAGGGSDEA